MDSTYSFTRHQSVQLYPKVSDPNKGRKKKSFNYYFLEGENLLRIYKSFYLKTLVVSQKMMHDIHEKKDHVDGRGKHNNHFRVRKDDKQKVNWPHKFIFCSEFTSLPSKNRCINVTILNVQKMALLSSNHLIIVTFSMLLLILPFISQKQTDVINVRK